MLIPQSEFDCRNDGLAIPGLKAGACAREIAAIVHFGHAAVPNSNLRYTGYFATPYSQDDHIGIRVY